MKITGKNAIRARKNGPGRSKKPLPAPVRGAANATLVLVNVHWEGLHQGANQPQEPGQKGGRMTTRSGKRTAAAGGDPSPGPSTSKRRRVSLEQQQASQARHSRSRTNAKRGKRLLTPGERLENDVNELLCTFGDCDPEHVKTKLELLTGDPHRADTVYQDLAGGGYPTLRERLQRQYAEQQQAELLREPNIELLIKRYSDKEGLLQKSRKRAAEGRHDVYKKQALSFIGNRCLYLPVPHIKRVIDKHPDVTSAYEQLKGEDERRQQRPRAQGRRGTYLLKPRTEPVPPPDQTCPEFTWDSLYIEKQHEIQEYKERQEASKTLRYMKAKSLGELEDCPICVDTYLQEDMLPCPSGHRFCTSCIHLSVKEQVCQGISLFPCLHLECKQHFDLHVLSQALPPSLYRTVEGKVQEEEVRLAGVPGLVSCPSCSYAVVFPEEGRGAVLQCENPHCFATTCRFCQDKAHPPYTCEQRAMAKARFRQHIENKMAEAVIRVCVSCDRRFVKAGGCNRMVCPNCNSVMCYVCGQKLENGYGHFNNDNERCRETNETLVHEQDLTRVIPRSKREFQQTHEEDAQYKDVTLDYDPLEDWRCRVLDEALVHEQDVTRVIPTAEEEFKQTHKEAEDLTLDYDPLEDWKSAPKAAPIPPPAFGAFGGF